MRSQDLAHTLIYLKNPSYLDHFPPHFPLRTFPCFNFRFDFALASSANWLTESCRRMAGAVG